MLHVIQAGTLALTYITGDEQRITGVTEHGYAEFIKYLRLYKELSQLAAELDTRIYQALRGKLPPGAEQWVSQVRSTSEWPIPTYRRGISWLGRPPSLHYQRSVDIDVSIVTDHKLEERYSAKAPLLESTEA